MSIIAMQERLFGRMKGGWLTPETAKTTVSNNGNGIFVFCFAILICKDFVKPYLHIYAVAVEVLVSD